jgi:eukaryotic-like serine/threonine-protein kinase
MTATIDRLRAALAGRYEISREIGQGGMATVYVAHDAKHDRDVAIKVLHPDLGAALGSERFLSEIKTTAKLQHPHILPLLDSGEADGLLYYVMPVVTGESLRVRLEREGQLSINESIRIAKETASALDYAHRHGVIHRDIKPENILLHDGQAIVGDFGIALAITAAGGARMTQTGLSLGTPQYMSPEQAMGERTVDARSDVYSLGAVTYEMLTGDAPFTGNSVQAIVSKIMTQRPTPISAVRDTIPETVENAVMIALSKLPADRFATAAEFATALTSPTTAFARTSGDIPRAGPGRRRIDVIAQRVGIPAIAIALIAGALALWGWLRPQPPRHVARFAITFDSSSVLRGNGGGAGSRFAISPDGSTIAFVGGPEQTIFIRSLNSLTPIQLPGTEGAFGPFFSPDGKQIGFSTQVFELKVVPVSGGASVLITDSSVSRAQGTWSSDGFIYVAARLAEGLYRVRPTVGASPELFTRVDGSAGEVGHGFASALPNGKGILFNIAYRGGKPPALAVADTKTKQYHVLLNGAGGGVYSASGHILYTEPGGTVMAVPFDEDKMKISGDAFPVIASNGPSRAGLINVPAGGGTEFAVSNNGTLVHASRSGVANELVWVSREGHRQSVDTAWKGAFSYVATSPDGRRLATSLSDATGSHVWVKELDHGPAHKLTFEGRNNNYPEWTPDGSSVSYYSDSRDPKLELFLKKADASAQAVPLTTFGNAVESAWSPDGKWLVLRTSVQGPGKGDIYAMRPGTDTTPIPLVATVYSERDPVVSRDGRWLAYTSNETGRYEVYVVPFPDAKAAKWPISNGGGSEPVWAHNGHELFYRSAAGKMMSVEFSGTPTFSTTGARVVFDAREYLVGASHRFWDISRDDQRFLMVKPSESASGQMIVVVENWFEELKAKH